MNLSDWETLMPEMIADMIKDAIGAADDHLKIAQEKLVQAQNALEMLRAADGHLLIATITKEATAVMADDENLEGQQLQNTQAFGLTGVWIGLAFFVSLIALVLYLRFNPNKKLLPSIRLPVKIGHWKINKERMRTWFQQLLNLIKLHQINEEKVRKEIKASIEDFRSMKERLKLMKLQKINKNDVKDIKAAIATVRSIEEHLKLMKSQKFNEEDEKEIQAALKPAIVAAQAMEKIINNGVWLLGHL